MKSLAVLKTSARNWKLIKSFLLQSNFSGLYQEHKNELFIYYHMFARSCIMYSVFIYEQDKETLNISPQFHKQSSFRLCSVMRASRKLHKHKKLDTLGNLLILNIYSERHNCRPIIIDKKDLLQSCF